MKPKEYLEKIHDLPCVLCAETGVEQTTKTAAHHYRHGQGISNKSADWLAIAICWDCHQGKHGWHGDKTRWRAVQWDESHALSATIEAMMRSV